MVPFIGFWEIIGKLNLHILTGFAKYQQPAQQYQLTIRKRIHVYHVYCIQSASCTAQGGAGSFKDRKL